MNEAYPRHYHSAREAFLAASKEAKAEVRSTEIKAKGPDDEALFVDVARLGQPGSDKALIVSSGMHGTELFAGSVCQCELLRSAPELTDLQVVLIHAINPWGAAHVRRNNETNIDLCRNFIDPAVKPPANEDYENLHEAALEAGDNTDIGRQARAELDRLRAELGDKRFNEALLGGQYRHRNGLSFGGYAPTESHKIMQQLLAEFASAQDVTILDLHTGLGESGQATVVSMQAEQPLSLASAWFSDRLVAPRANRELVGDDFPQVYGHPTEAHERLLPETNLVSAVIEFGTYEHARVTEAILKDHWAEHHGLHPADKALVKDFLLETFSPVDPAWINKVRTEFSDLLNTVLQAMRA